MKRKEINAKLRTPNVSRKNSGHKVRVSPEYPWKILGHMCSDLESQVVSDVVLAELKKLSSIVRKRDLLSYINACKNEWALKSMQHLASVLQTEGHNTGEILRMIRIVRLFTIFQKYPFPNSPVDKRAVAFRTFLSYEQLCRKTNLDPIFQVFEDEEDSPNLTTYDNLVTCKVLMEAKRWILTVLGPQIDLVAFCANLRHGPGSTTDKRGQFSIPIEKFRPPFSCTKTARKFFLNAIKSDMRWLRSLNDFDRNTESLDYYEADEDSYLKEFTSSRLSFVEKTAETNRTITIEPTANMYLQLGIDHLIRSKLKKHGFDINTQEKNQYLARYASESNELVTIDLSSASDSIALAWLNLFPPKWSDMLLALRTHSTTIECYGIEAFSLEKISAMGNGYTFALETLIFASLIHGVYKALERDMEHEMDYIAVYGDDIIIPKDVYSCYSYILHRLGLRENVNKTFSNGPIRESCGCDYFDGKRIDRFTIKNEPKECYEVCIHHNNFFQAEEKYGVSFSSTRKYISSHDDQRNYGPSDDDLCSWYFSSAPRQSFNKDYQRIGYSVKRYVITHPKMKFRTGSECFVPMLYNLKSKSTVQSNGSACYLSQTKVGLESLYDYLESINDETSQAVHYFRKNRMRIRKLRAFVPI